MMVRLEHVERVFQSSGVGSRALADVSFRLAPGEYVALLGPSGCGKSTLLNVVGLLDRPTGGEYFFQDVSTSSMTERDLDRLRRGRINFVFQQFNLVDELTVAENVALPLQYSDVPRHSRVPRVLAMLERLGLSHRANHRPAALSGGQQQRVAVARALVTEPLLLLADEPTGNLDSAHAAEVLQLFDEIHAQGTTILMVTHSDEVAGRAARSIHMRDGRVTSDCSAPAGLQVRA